MVLKLGTYLITYKRIMNLYVDCNKESKFDFPWLVLIKK